MKPKRRDTKFTAEQQVQAFVAGSCLCLVMLCVLWVVVTR